ncbi:hypothetical protein [Ancylobacter sp.]|uniref:hypothetical protein n=1 Tax=Ancylobacter sp. TaxID=1872567 RepID=UPI003D146691
MIGENKHVAFDADLCRANPEAAADKIAELEYALSAAGQLDRMRVIGFTKLQGALQLSETRRKSLTADWKSLDSVCTRQMARIAELVETLRRAEWWLTTKPDGANMAQVIRAVVDGRDVDGATVRDPGIPEIVTRLRERAVAARAEGTATALGDALHFEEAAALIAMMATPRGYDPTTQPFDEPFRHVDAENPSHD